MSNNIFLELIEKYRDLLSVYDDPDTDNWFSEIKGFNENIKQAMELDETYITAVVILRNSIMDYLIYQAVLLQ